MSRRVQESTVSKGVQNHCQTCPNVSKACPKRVQTCSNVSKRVQTCPNVSKTSVSKRVQNNPSCFCYFLMEMAVRFWTCLDADFKKDFPLKFWTREYFGRVWQGILAHFRHGAARCRTVPHYFSCSGGWFPPCPNPFLSELGRILSEDRSKDGQAF